MKNVFVSFVLTFPLFFGGKNRVFGPFWKCARIGERLSPYVSICCVLMAVSVDVFFFPFIVSSWLFLGGVQVCYQPC